VVASIAPPLGPEQLLERIAELRQQGKHEEADKALAEFRQRYPEYRISDEMLKKVERPK
jgi:TolA-binding protein